MKTLYAVIVLIFGANASNQSLRTAEDPEAKNWKKHPKNQIQLQGLQTAQDPPPTVFISDQIERLDVKKLFRILFLSEIEGNITFTKTTYNRAPNPVIEHCLWSQAHNSQQDLSKCIQTTKTPNSSNPGASTQKETFELVWHYGLNTEKVFKLDSPNLTLIRGEDYWFTLPELFRFYDNKKGECFSLDFKTMSSSFRYKITPEQCRKLVNLVVKKTKKAKNITNFFTGFAENYGSFRLLALKEKLIGPGGVILLANLDSRNPLVTYKSLIQGDIYNQLTDPLSLILIYEKGPFEINPPFISQKYVFVQSCTGNQCSNQVSSQLAIPFTSYSEDPNRLILRNIDCMMVIQNKTRPPQPYPNPFGQKSAQNRPRENLEFFGDFGAELNSGDQISYFVYCLALYKNYSTAEQVLNVYKAELNTGAKKLILASSNLTAAKRLLYAGILDQDFQFQQYDPEKIRRFVFLVYSDQIRSKFAKQSTTQPQSATSSSLTAFFSFRRKSTSTPRQR